MPGADRFDYKENTEGISSFRLCLLRESSEKPVTHRKVTYYILRGVRFAIIKWLQVLRKFVNFKLVEIGG